jgi:hypothetical protein
MKGTLALSGLCLMVVAVGAPLAPLPQQVTFDCGERFALDYPGPEDIELDTASADGPRLIISAQERRVTDSHHGSYYRGEILFVPLAGAHRGVPTPFSIDGQDPATPFHPHGISLVQTPRGLLLYVINHASGRSGRVEIFQVDGAHLIAVKPLCDSPFLNRPNDLIALPNGDVYVTNLSRHDNAIADLFTVLVGASSGTVVRYRDAAWKVVASGIGLANGIAVTPDQRRFFVAGSRDRGVHVYAPDPKGDLWRERRDEFINLGQGVDNLTWEVPGEVLIAARHLSAPRLLQHAQHPERHSPAEVVRIRLGGPEVTRFRLEPDPTINAISVGIMRQGVLYLGQVYDAGVYACRQRMRP